MTTATEPRKQILPVRLTRRDGKLAVDLPQGFTLGGFIFQDARSGLRFPIPPDVGMNYENVMFHPRVRKALSGPVLKACPDRSSLGFNEGWRGKTITPEPVDGIDPSVIGFDGQLYQPVSSVQYQTSSMTWASAGSASIRLPNNLFITEVLIVADPFATSGTATNLAQDPMDKLYSALFIAGGPTYYTHNDAIAIAKALGNQNKLVYAGAVPRTDFAAGGSATANTPEAHRIHFGALNDHMPFDITAGIPAQLEATLTLGVTFPANSVIAGSGQTITTSTIVYVVVEGVIGLEAYAGYLQNAPIPDFRLDVVASPTSTTTFNLLGNRFLKRSTVISQATVANADNPRNDSNMTDVSIVINKPTMIRYMDRVRWQVAKALLQGWGGRFGGVDANGASAVAPGGLVGILPIDWRKITGNPFGLDTFNLPATGDAQIIFTVGTTTGQISIYHEYYAIRSGSQADVTLAQMRAWGNRGAFQPV